MKRMKPILIILISCIVMALGPSMASNYAFGTKVCPQDSDLGRPLKNMPDSTVISFWDIGPNQGIYDSGDVVYIDAPPTGIANVNDIRLTSFGDYHAGTKVKPDDKDMNAPLKPMTAEIRFLNLNGSQSYDINDPVYVHQSDYVTPSPSIVPYNTQDVPNNKATIPYDTVSNAANIAAANSTASNLVDKFEKQIVGSVYSMNPATIYANEGKNGSAAAIPENPIAIEGFWQRLSYTGYCNNLPLGTTCLIYSDGFIWPVSDSFLDNSPYVAGFDNIRRPIEVIYCNNADYYHIIGTLFVKSVPRLKELFTQSTPLQTQTPPNMAANPEYIGNEDMSRVIEAVNRAVANLDSIRTNDIRLTSIGALASGTKVINFDPDLNRPVALPVLVSFPRKPDDYACIRVYDANGNGLYDSSDDVYMDISFPGYSSFGTVSVNDVRLSSPSVVT